ncbi:hypothetical protein LY76DRAFT_105357 [Colletotrichum caudatum]|nr:hypothetical protein LY76DRAFT_105357 [Colletotrichum caudatum]
MWLFFFMHRYLHSMRIMLYASCFGGGSHPEFLSGSGSAACNGCEVIYSRRGRERERDREKKNLEARPSPKLPQEIIAQQNSQQPAPSVWVWRATGPASERSSYRYDSHTSAE